MADAVHAEIVVEVVERFVDDLRRIEGLSVAHAHCLVARDFLQELVLAVVVAEAYRYGGPVEDDARIRVGERPLQILIPVCASVEHFYLEAAFASSGGHRDGTRGAALLHRIGDGAVAASRREGGYLVRFVCVFEREFRRPVERSADEGASDAGELPGSGDGRLRYPDLRSDISGELYLHIGMAVAAGVVGRFGHDGYGSDVWTSGERRDVEPPCRVALFVEDACIPFGARPEIDREGIGTRQFDVVHAGVVDIDVCVVVCARCGKCREAQCDGDIRKGSSHVHVRRYGRWRKRSGSAEQV